MNEETCKCCSEKLTFNWISEERYYYCNNPDCCMLEITNYKGMEIYVTYLDFILKVEELVEKMNNGTFKRSDRKIIPWEIIEEAKTRYSLAEKTRKLIREFTEPTEKFNQMCSQAKSDGKKMAANAKRKITRMANEYSRLQHITG